MSDFPKILLITPHLGGGGAERVIELLTCHLPAEKYDVELALVTRSAIPEPSLPESVVIHRIDVKRVRLAAAALVKLVRDVQPDVILSSMFHLNFLVLALRPLFPRKVKILVRQNGSASAMLSGLSLPFLTKVLYRTLYPAADRVLCQSSAMADDLCRNFGVQASRLTVLPNPVDIETVRTVAASSRSEWTGLGPHLLSIARIRPEKGIDLLLQAFFEFKKHLPMADLTIVGDGPLRSQAAELAGALGLMDCVRFAGSVFDPARFFKGASLFVLPSRHEGMPNALLEAAAAGLPIVSTPASAGLTDLLRGNEGCWVTDETNASSLSQTMVAAIHTLQPGQRFLHEWVEQFSLDKAIAAYQSVIDDALGNDLARRQA
ncbi:MAG TPA: glycosyltransferase [Terracidiphilus sp.]|nr:glycosyltransferase [Terracidiphilus sp.]